MSKFKLTQFIGLITNVCAEMIMGWICYVAEKHENIKFQVMFMKTKFKLFLVPLEKTLPNFI